MYVQQVDEHITIQLLRDNPPTQTPSMQRWRYLVARELVTVARGVVQTSASQQAAQVAGRILAELAEPVDVAGPRPRAA
jgi:hypothetical protein